MGNLISDLFEDEKSQIVVNSEWGISPSEFYQTTHFETSSYRGYSPPRPAQVVTQPTSAHFVTPTNRDYLALRPAVAPSQFKSTPVGAPSTIKSTQAVTPTNRGSLAPRPDSIVAPPLKSVQLVKPTNHGYLAPRPSTAVTPSQFKSTPVGAHSTIKSTQVATPTNHGGLAPRPASVVAPPLKSAQVVKPTNRGNLAPRPSGAVTPSQFKLNPAGAPSTPKSPQIVMQTHTQLKSDPFKPAPAIISQVFGPSVVPTTSQKLSSSTLRKNSSVKKKQQSAIQFKNTATIAPLHHVQPRMIFSIDEHKTEGIKLTKFLNEKFSKPIKSVNVIKLPISDEEIFGMEIPFETKKAYDVRCPSIFAAYMLRKKEYDIKNKLTTEEFIHATPTKKVNQILEHNLNYRKNYRYRFGTGVCFTPHFNYAFNCTKNKSELISFIICEVLIGELVNRKVRYQRDISIDTGVGNNGDVYVKARDDEFIPLLVFEKLLDSPMYV